MRTLLSLPALGVVLGVVLVANAASPNEVAVGKIQISWENLEGVDGQRHSLADLADRDFVVVAITCNHCPIAIEYYDRMKAFARDYCGARGQVALVAISLSNLETDRLERMKEMAERRGFNFPYLYDGSQRIGQALGATITPQFFVLDRQRTLVYRGAWDNHLNETKVTERYIESTIQALARDEQPPVAETRAKGCLIRYDNN